MLPSSNDSEQSEISSQPTPSPAQAVDLPGIDTEQLFRLIDSILPFEACLYYQFLPLALEGKYLKLGMVDPNDSSALGYVRHILAYLNCALKKEQISTDTHQAVLSAYLNHIHSTPSPPKPPAKKKDNLPRSEQPTLILEDDTLPDGNPAPSSPLPIPPAPPPLPAPESLAVPTNVSSLPTPPQPSGVPPEKTITPASIPPPPAPPLPRLVVRSLYLSRPLEFIASLPPQQLLPELLGRVLIGGIGRLYFERQANGGRILWSQDGVLQSILEGLSLSIFQGVILELKRFANIPLMPVIQPRQVEIERLYQDECLLLRLQVMPGNHGEEATLQVLRGVALKFYQRQKLEKLGQESLKLTQQLQRKLSEIRDRSSRYSLPLEALPALQRLLNGLDKQLEALAQLPVNQQSDQ